MIQKMKVRIYRSGVGGFQILVLVFFVSGCVHKKDFSDVGSSRANDRIANLSQKINFQKKVIQDLKDQNRLLRKLLEGKKETRPLAYEYGGIDKISSLVLVSEAELYKRAQRAFENKDLSTLAKVKDEFLNRFPISTFADNIIYWKGQLELELRHPMRSLSSFDELIKSYSSGNKLVAALLGKAQAHQMMKEEKKANNIYFEIIRKYPGSPEAVQAKNLVKTLN